MHKVIVKCDVCNKELEIDYPFTTEDTIESILELENWEVLRLPSKKEHEAPVQELICCDDCDDQVLLDKLYKDHCQFDDDKHEGLLSVCTDCGEYTCSGHSNKDLRNWLCKKCVSKDEEEDLKKKKEEIEKIHPAFIQEMEAKLKIYEKTIAVIKKQPNGQLMIKFLENDLQCFVEDSSFYILNEDVFKYAEYLQYANDNVLDFSQWILGDNMD